MNNRFLIEFSCEFFCSRHMGEMLLVTAILVR